jgi:hypothetical protein
MIALPIACGITGTSLVDGSNLLPDLTAAGVGLSLGPELLTNGDFATDTVWTKGVGWTIAAGLATCTTPGVTSSLSVPFAFIPGRTYQMTIVVSSMTAAALVPRGYLASAVAFPIGATITTAGTYTRLRVASAADTFAIDGSAAAIASIDSVSLRLVI